LYLPSQLTFSKKMTRPPASLLEHASLRDPTPRQEAPRPPGETPGMLVLRVRLVFKAWSYILS
jgi:hypothetical protein